MLPLSSLEKVLAHTAPDAAPALEGPVAAATQVARVFAGRTTLDEWQLEKLKVGDVVLCGGLSIQSGKLVGALRVLGNGFSVKGLAAAHGLLVERFDLLTKATEMTVLHTPDPTASVPVDVEVELASVRLSLQELSRLRPGEIVPLRVSVTEPVVIRIGERVVAKAELVDLDGEVGARILSLEP